MAGKDGAPALRRVDVRELRADLPSFLRQVRNGATILITSRDEVVAELRPPPALERPHRKPGALRGRIRMAPDFDRFPDEMLAAMEGEEQ